MDRAELIAKYPGYHWLIARGLVGWAAFTALQPWHYLPEEEMFYATERWPSGPSEAPLLVFARRQDCDDLACFREAAGHAAEVVTIEGVAKDGTLHPVQEAFREHHALQCGFCTPGMIMTAIDMIGRKPALDRKAIRAELDGNICRCTGYHNIVNAIEVAAKGMAEPQR